MYTLTHKYTHSCAHVYSCPAQMLSSPYTEAPALGLGCGLGENNTTNTPNSQGAVSSDTGNVLCGLAGTQQMLTQYY